MFPFKNSWRLRQIRHIFDLWMITSNSQCNFFRPHFTNEYKFVRYLLLCLFIYLFFSIFASVSLLQEGTRDHGHYEYLLEGKLLWKWSWLLWTSLGRKHHSNNVQVFFHFPSNLLGIMKFGWDGWVAKALNSCPLYSKGSLLWHIDSRPQATGSTPRLIVQKGTLYKRWNSERRFYTRTCSG